MQSSNRKNYDQSILDFERLWSLEWKDSGVQPDYQIQLLIDGLDAATDDSDAEQSLRQKHAPLVRFLKRWRLVDGRQLSLFDDDQSPLKSYPASQSSPSRPPGTLDGVHLFFSIFMSHDQRDAIVGDLEERSRHILKTEDRRTATFWFWRQLVHTFMSLSLDRLKQLSGFERFIERFRRIGS